MQDESRVVVEGRKTNWWLIVGGIVLVLFAIGTFAMPWLFLELVTIWAGVGFVVAGVAGIGNYLQIRKLGGSPWVLLMSILDIAVGVLMLVHPVVFASMLPWLLGAAFIAFGIIEIIGTTPLSRLMPESRTVMVISGVLTIIVGIMFVVWPTSLSIWVAAFAAVRGISLIVLGITARTQ